MRVHTCLLGLAVAVAASASFDARALERVPVVNAAGACQSALPAFDGNIRKRPTGVSNEGTAPAFVSCSVYGDLNVEVVAPSGGLGILLSNNTGAAASISCTLVNGFRIIQSPVTTSIPKIFTVPANQTAEVAITTEDNGGEPFNTPIFSLSCNLPVGTEINSLYTQIEDGSAPAE
jgi:hypothetical protein